jgi:bifunctional DNA-binding transcriptional regulator/antitoxin component of YhaV-PrlF toxin-antitoxin module
LKARRERSIVAVSSDCRVVIPRGVRKGIGLKPGQKLIALEKVGIISLVPDEPLSRLRESLRGMSVEGVRDERDGLQR